MSPNFDVIKKIICGSMYGNFALVELAAKRLLLAYYDHIRSVEVFIKP